MSLKFGQEGPPCSHALVTLSALNSLVRRRLLIFNTSRLAIPAAIYRSAQGPGPESSPQSAFWVFLGPWLGVPQGVLFECFLAFLGLKNAKKHSKSTLWGTPSQGPKHTQKALRGALSGPGPSAPGKKEYTPPPWHPSFFRSVARPRGHRAKKAMVYTIFLGKQGKRVYTIGPEKGYTP